jgi:hypothetical protein
LTCHLVEAIAEPSSPAIEIAGGDRNAREDARLAREKGWCDDSLSDKTAAAIYRERTYPWLS